MTVQIAVLGAGLIGRRHIEHIRAVPEAALAAIVDPMPAAQKLAQAIGAPWYQDLRAMLAHARPDGVIIATPNQWHVANGLEAVAAGIPALIEKPIADDLATGEKLVAAAEADAVPLLVGHHRRHNPMIQRAHQIIAEGRLGRIVAVHGFFWLMKPDDYFGIAWRRETGAGPVLTNLSHDIDLLRYLCGEIVSVQALQSNAVRQFAVDETTALLMQFVSGAIGSFSLTDTVVAPWSWEHTTGENPIYPRTGESCYFIGGTKGSLSIPKLELWTNEAKPSWWEPFRTERILSADADPLRLQIKHFCRVILGEEVPLVAGREGLNTLRVMHAVAKAARSGATERVAE